MRSRVGAAVLAVGNVLPIVTAEHVGHPLAELVRGPGVGVERVAAALAYAARFQVFAVLKQLNG